MIIHDRIYGDITLTSPLIIDLINSKPFQRLKKINQHGAGNYIQPYRNVTRYEHCIGAWYLSEKFKRPIEEQVASLLHDIPHTAFSHVIDYVVHDKKHEYHDRFLKKIILNSEIPQILANHSISLEKILVKNAFPLLNNDLPDISVDRWDYFMRDGFTCNLLPHETIKLFLDHIQERNQKFYFTDTKIASLFAIMFMNCARLLWLDPTSIGSFLLLSAAIKLGLQKKYITQEDFFTNDEVLMKKLRSTEDEEILHFLNRLKPKKEFYFAPREQAEFYAPNKPRFVDPWVMEKGKLVLLSTVIPALHEYHMEFKKRYAYEAVSQS
ncbi:MAG: HD domain-containing protein [Candidatus Levyibacteriota bacterium]